MKKTLIFGLVLGLLSFAMVGHSNQKKVALVKMKRGKAQVVSPNGVKSELKKGDWIVEGSTVKTQKKSFVRLSFIDKSSMNVGPGSEMKIEKFSKDEAGVINVLSGKIRSQVTKNYLNMNKDKSKLFVKSKSAVMGIRGTDFAFTTSKKTGASTAVLFEGSVVFNKIKKGQKLKNLEAIVNRGHRIKPGQFSVASKGMKHATVPAKMNSSQFSNLESNSTFSESNVVVKKKKMKSLIPDGLSGEVVKSEAMGLKSIAVGAEKKEKVDMNMAKGFVKGDEIKPADGSMVHIESGTVIPIPSDAMFDSSSGEFVSTTAGNIDSSGVYTAPDGFNITDEGQFMKEMGGGQVVEIQMDIKPVDEMPKFNDLQQVQINELDRMPADDGSAMNSDPTDPIVQKTCEGCSVFIPVNGGAEEFKKQIQQNTQPGKTRVKVNIR